MHFRIYDIIASLKSVFSLPSTIKIIKKCSLLGNWNTKLHIFRFLINRFVSWMKCVSGRVSVAFLHLRPPIPPTMRNYYICVMNTYSLFIVAKNCLTMPVRRTSINHSNQHSSSNTTDFSTFTLHFRRRRSDGVGHKNSVRFFIMCKFQTGFCPVVAFVWIHFTNCEIWNSIWAQRNEALPSLKCPSPIQKILILFVCIICCLAWKLSKCRRMENNFSLPHV